MCMPSRSGAAQQVGSRDLGLPRRHFEQLPSDREATGCRQYADLARYGDRLWER